MHQINYATSNVAVATLRQRREVLRRVRLPDALAAAIADLAFPSDPDRADRHPAIHVVGMPEVPA